MVCRAELSNVYLDNDNATALILAHVVKGSGVYKTQLAFHNDRTQILGQIQAFYKFLSDTEILPPTLAEQRLLRIALPDYEWQSNWGFTLPIVMNILFAHRNNLKGVKDGRRVRDEETR
jgi:hypothetical protein